jgi:hypothetical protein
MYCVDKPTKRAKPGNFQMHQTSAPAVFLAGCRTLAKRMVHRFLVVILRTRY